MWGAVRRWSVADLAEEEEMSGDSLALFGNDVLVGEILPYQPSQLDRMKAWVEAFDLWLASRGSPHTRRVYRYAT